MEYDIIVIGSGPGGYVAAIRASQLGKKTAIVERAELGGVCLNWGCIPTKALLKSAQVLGYARSAASYGIEISGEAVPDMAKIVARSRSVAETMSRGVDFLLKKNNVDIIAGHGRLKGGGVVGITTPDGSQAEYTAEHIILATGARSREMPFMPVDGKHIINARQAMTLDRIPESMVVVGSGAIGCEFACLYAMLGSKVTIIEYLPDLMPLEDEDVSRQMERSFRKLRATVMTGTTVRNVTVADGKCAVEIEGKKGAGTITCDVVLSAVGVTPNIDDIGLEETGVIVENGKVAVDEFYRTNISGVYAIGDIVATPALAHVATAEAICCVEKICGHTPAPIDYTNVPSCVYTTPEVASVGFTEKQAREKGYRVRIGKFPFTASGKAVSAGDRDGFVKLVIDDTTDKLLGAHMVGGNVTEMIAEPVVAKALGATAHSIAAIIHPHPTMSEAVMEAAEASCDSCVHL